MNIQKLIVSVVLVAALSSCGDKEPESLIGTVSGSAHISKGGDDIVSIYSVANEQTGEESILLAQTQTAEDGSYSVDIEGESQWIILHATDKGYYSEATRSRFNLAGGNTLYSIAYYESGSPLTAMITSNTMLAFGLAGKKLEEGVVDIGAAFEAGLAEMNEVVGFDILSTNPADIYTPRIAE